MLKPADGSIFVEKISNDMYSKSDSGIIIPTVGQNDYYEMATVIACGDGVEFSTGSGRSTMCVNVGDTVFFPKGQGAALTYKGKEYFLDELTCGESIIKAIKESNCIYVPEELIRVSSAFKGGIASKGHICGCLLSSISLLGLKYGRTNKEDNLELLDKKVSLFYEQFEKKNKSALCKEITKSFRDQGLFKSPERRKFCSEIVGQTLDDLNVFLRPEFCV